VLQVFTTHQSEFLIHAAYIQTEQSEACEKTRLSCADEHQNRQIGSEAPSRQGPKTSHTLISLENRFPQCFRLRKAENYKRVYDSGNKKVGQFLQVLYHPNGSPQARVGISVASRLGKAVERNKVKRWIREALRKNKGFIRPGLDIVVHPKVKVLTGDSRTIERELQSLLASLNRKGEVAILNENNTDQPKTV
jgi:ribonuclease P protein component